MRELAKRMRSRWLPGVIDPASVGRGQMDGKKLSTEYRQLGLNLSHADNAVEAGIFAVYERLGTGKLLIFSTCRNWFEEYRNYHRDENGKVVKVDDHLMDATRYFILSGLNRAQTEPSKPIVMPPVIGDSRVGL